MRQEFEFYRPQTLKEMSRIISEGTCRVIAGGTDLIPQLRKDIVSTPVLVDISRLADLRFIEEQNGWIRIGALSTQSELETSQLLQSCAPLLSTAAGSIGCPQTRNRATLGGNLANASPAADTIPPLLVLDAEVILLSSKGERNIPLDKFLLGPSKIACAPDEIIHSITFPVLPDSFGMSFRKLGKRKGMAIAIVSVAVALSVDKTGILNDVRIALGSVAPKAVRSPHVEEILINQVPNPDLLQQASEAVLNDIQPISDIRSSAVYRQHAAVHLLNQALQEALKKTNERSAA